MKFFKFEITKKSKKKNKKIFTKESLKKLPWIIFYNDHYLLFVIISLYLYNIGMSGIRLVFVSYAVTAIWYFLKRVLLGLPVKVSSLLKALVLAPLALSFLIR